MTNKRQLAAEIAEVIGKLLREEFENSDLCVLATKVGVDVYRYFGIYAKPTVVRAIAFNELFAKASDEFRRAPDWRMKNPVTGRIIRLVKKGEL